MLIDGFGRKITYLRLSVTDRCDLRCRYCLAEDTEFLPRHDLLSQEELQRLCDAFIHLGVRKIRLTGGEPLVRRGVMETIEALGRRVAAGQLDELTLTTNGTQLARHAGGLAAAGIRRLNVSLDTLDPARFRTLTRGGNLASVLAGIDAAQAAGLAIKINAVALAGINEDEIDGLLGWCGERGFDLCLIETMPLGEPGHHTTPYYLPLSLVRERLEARWTLRESDWRGGGPARYVDVGETGHRLGFITPLSNTFCEGCNRVRVTCSGSLYTCLGHNGSVDLRAPLRASEGDAAIEAAILSALAVKPKGHDFLAGHAPAFARTMNVTGG